MLSDWSGSSITVVLPDETVHRTTPQPALLVRQVGMLLLLLVLLHILQTHVARSHCGVN